MQLEFNLAIARRFPCKELEFYLAKYRLINMNWIRNFG